MNDPKLVFAEALAGASDNNPERMARAASEYLELGRRNGDPEMFLRASEFFDLAGDLELSRNSLLAGREICDWKVQKLFVYRAQGLMVRRLLGDETFEVLRALGHALVTAEPDGRRLMGLVQALKALGAMTLLSEYRVQLPRWNPSKVLPPVIDLMFGPFCTELMKLGAFVAADSPQEVEQTAFKVKPYLARMAPDLAKDLVANLGVPYELAASIIRRPWKTYEEVLCVVYDEPKLLEAARARPNSPAPRFQLAIGHAREGRIEAALAELDRALEIAPWYSDAHFLKGTLLLDFLKDAGAALACFERALDLNPWHLDAMVSQGIALFRLERIEQARQVVTQAMVLLPDYKLPNALYCYGTGLLDADQFSEAEPVLRRATESDPQRAEAWVNLGIALQNLGRFPEAVTALSQGKQLAPELHNASLHRARCYARLGKNTAARQDYESLLSTPLQDVARAELASVPKPGFFGRLLGQ